MTESVKEKIDVLVKLQDIEMQRAKIETELDRVSKEIDVLDSAMAQFDQKVAEDEAHVSELSKEYRDYESDIETNQAQLNKSREKLDSVKNNKEYQSILKEIDELNLKNSSIEDKMIECLNRIDEAQEKIAETRQEHSRISEQNKSEKEDIYKQIEQGKKELEDLQKNWETVSGTVDKDLMEHYLDVKGKIKGRNAIAPVTDAVCDGCHMNIPPQTYNELQRFDSMKYCPFCHRIIYWKV